MFSLKRLQQITSNYTQYVWGSEPPWWVNGSASKLHNRPCCHLEDDFYAMNVQKPCMSSISSKRFTLSFPSLIKKRIFCLSWQSRLFSISCLIVCCNSPAIARTTKPHFRTFTRHWHRHDYIWEWEDNWISISWILNLKASVSSRYFTTVSMTSKKTHSQSHLANFQSRLILPCDSTFTPFLLLCSQITSRDVIV